MNQHVKILGVLNIVWGAFGALCGLIILMIFGGLYGYMREVAYRRAETSIALPIVAIVGGAVSLFLLFVSTPSVIAGIALLYFKPWGRMLAIVVSALHLVNIPLGTALGIYGLWVLFSPEAQRLFTPTVST